MCSGVVPDWPLLPFSTYEVITGYTRRGGLRYKKGGGVIQCDIKRETFPSPNPRPLNSMERSTRRGGWTTLLDARGHLISQPQKPPTAIRHPYCAPNSEPELTDGSAGSLYGAQCGMTQLRFLGVRKTRKSVAVADAVDMLSRIQAVRPPGNTKGYSSTYLAIRFANVRAGTWFPPEHQRIP